MKSRGILLLLCAGLCQAETRRALLVGINEYLPDDPAAAVKVWKPTPLRPIPVLGAPARLSLPSLHGAENDAQQMADVLEQRFGFKHENIQILRSSEATADRILTTLKSFLIDQAAAGDVSLFFYAGHGSRMRNTKSEVESKMDSTILPADSTRGVPDIRGKELARIYRQAVAKRVTLTVIQDSCYSGSGARGALYSGVTERAVEPDTRYVEDAFTDEHGAPMKFPEDEGVLVLSASQDYQPAAELARTDLNGPHGVFTWALLKVLWTVSENESVDTIYQRTRALMQSRVPSQEPVMAGKGRESRGLLGQPASSLRSRLVPVARYKDGVVTLGGGFAMGLRDGTELKRYASKDAPVEIKITKVTGINSAEAKIAESAPGAKVAAGDMFQLDRWVVPDDDTLRVFFPRPAPPLADIESVAQALRPLRRSAAVRWLDDPTVSPPDHVLSWDGKEWTLAPPGGGKPVSFGGRPTAIAVAKAMGNRGSLFVLLPPSKELLESIVLGTGTGNDAVRITSADEQPDYVLLGRPAKDGTGIEYAWALPHLTASDLTREVAEAHARKLPPPKNALPLRSAWVDVSPANTADAGANLTDLALRLSRIRGWIQLAPPAEAEEFPYHLALLNAVTNEAKTEGETFEGETYRLVLQADRKELDAMQSAGGVPQRWVYVFVIDSKGRSQLVYPPPGRGAVGNRLPVLADDQSKAPAVISLTGRGGEFSITPPFGVDTFYMLASEERVPDPSVLTFDGVNMGERGMGGATPLGRLLVDVGAGSRGVTTYTGAVPVNWGIERHLFLSQAK